MKNESREVTSTFLIDQLLNLQLQHEYRERERKEREQRKKTSKPHKDV